MKAYPKLRLVNCLAHVRRKFADALDSDRNRVEIAMLKFQKVYEVERESRKKNINSEQRKELRVKRALPILNELGKWISAISLERTPKSPLGKACHYCINHWDNLLAYLHNGDLEIDNNLAENAIRPIALGRKNWHRGYFWVLA
ncbi:MAG: transposase [Mangrovibacterium sp.]